MERQVRALQVVGTALLLIAMLAVLVWVCLSPRFGFVNQLGDAPWIAAAPAPSTFSHVASVDALPVTRFAREVSLSDPSAPLRLEVEALRGFVLRVNGHEVARREWQEEAWREVSVTEVREGLQAHHNLIEVDVANHRGPALLRMRGTAPGLSILSDSGFRVSHAGGPEQPAVVADDRLLAREVVTGPVVGPGFERLGAWLGLLFVAGLVLAYGAAQHPEWVARYGLGTLVVIAGALWVWLFFAKFQNLPVHTGFDGPHHLEYVRYLLEHRALPSAYDGDQMYQPPLFYALSALLVALFGGTQGADQVVLHLLPFACGVVQVVTATVLARSLFPEDRLKQGATLVATACIPLNIYMAAYLSNEVAYASLSSLAILATCRVLQGGGTSWLAAAGLGALIGLAFLTKVSALLLLPTIAAFLFVRDRLVARMGIAASIGRVALLAVVASAIASGFLWRNQRLYGSAVIGNWDLPGKATAWWQTPGFHTPDYFLRFGEVLRRPYFASFDSFWDGLYSTFFGDGMAAGVAAWRYRHEFWNYDLMSAGYVLAVPVALLMLLGFALLTRRAFSEPDLGRRAALSFLVTLTAGTVFATLVLNIDHPVYSMAHARYLLCVLVPLTLCLAEGFVYVDTRLSAPNLGAVRLAYRAWTGGIVLVWALSFAS